MTRHTAWGGRWAAPRSHLQQKFRRRKRYRKLWLVLILLVFPVVVLTGYTWVTLHYAYSLCERFGYVQKVSNKGWLCNTWECELAMTTVPGTAPQIFQFSVRDDATAQRIEERRYCITYFTLTRYVGTEGKISFTIAELDRYLERRRERDLMSHSDGAGLALPPQVREVLSEKRITS